MRVDEYGACDSVALAALVRAGEVTAAELRDAATQMHAATHPLIHAVVEWYGPKRLRDPHFGEALHSGLSDQLDAETALMRLAEDPNEPAMARASALALLGRRFYFGLRDAHQG